MRLRLLPVDEAFFDLLAGLSDRLADASHLLEHGLRHPDQTSQWVPATKEVERAANHSSEEILTRLWKTFITPFDHHHIHELTRRLDFIVDQIDGVAQRVRVYRIHETPQPARELAAVLVHACEILRTSVHQLRKPQFVLNHIREIRVLEKEGDAKYRDAISHLFEGDPDPIEVVKWKDIYDRLEDTIDECNHVALVMEGIALLHA